jgi:26S proteasome regulatory subunit N5
MKEEEGDLQEAARILQELQVETYGSMERKEKVIHQSINLCSFCGSGNTLNQCW